MKMCIDERGKVSFISRSRGVEVFLSNRTCCPDDFFRPFGQRHLVSFEPDQGEQS